MLLSGVIGLVIFASFPVAPPRLAEPGVVVDTVTLHSHAYRVLQPAAFTNPYAAMPSLHVGWNLLVGITLARTSRSRAVRLFGWLMPVAMVLAVVLTANHYLLDAVCGALIALGSLSITSRWVRPASPAAVVSPTGASLVEKEPV
jgi:membrane-associated phospholipid phosphatase